MSTSNENNSSQPPPLSEVPLFGGMNDAAAAAEMTATTTTHTTTNIDDDDDDDDDVVVVGDESFTVPTTTTSNRMTNTSNTTQNSSRSNCNMNTGTSEVEITTVLSNHITNDHHHNNKRPRDSSDDDVVNTIVNLLNDTDERIEGTVSPIIMTTTNGINDTTTSNISFVTTETKDVKHSNDTKEWDDDDDDDDEEEGEGEERRSWKKQKSSHNNDADDYNNNHDHNRNSNSSTIEATTTRSCCSNSDEIVVTTPITTTITTIASHHKNPDTNIAISIYEKSLASSVPEYLNQAKQQRTIQHRNNNKKKKKKNHSHTSSPNHQCTDDVPASSSSSSSLMSLKYLPRPEWCAMTNVIMYQHIQNWKRHNPVGIDLHTMVAKIINIDDDDEKTRYLRHFLLSTPTKKKNQKNQNDVNTDTITPSPEQIDSMTQLLTNNIIYFDPTAYRWDTKQIEGGGYCDLLERNTNITTTKEGLIHDTTTSNNNNNNNNSATTKSSSSSSSLDHPQPHLQMTFKSIMQQQPSTCLKLSKDSDSILHMAIKENATLAALDIIRIEYNTYLHTIGAAVAAAVRKKLMHVSLNFLEPSLLVAKNDKGVTPFILAAQKGNIQVVKQLLHCDVSILEKSNNGSTAILQAAHFGHVKVIEYIIEFYETNQETKRLVTPTMFWPETVADFIDQPNVNQTTPLMRAAQEGHISTVALLLKHRPSAVHSRNSVQMTPLMLAAQRGHTKMCRLLIRHGADINAKTNQNSTALLLACKRGHIAVVKELVSAGCELHHTDNRNRTAQQVIQRRVQQHHPEPITGFLHPPPVVPNPPPVPRRRRNDRRPQHRNRGNDDQQIDGNDDRDEGGDNDEGDNHNNLISLRTNEAILQMLNPQIQLELMRLSLRAQRNFELIRLYNLFHSNRATIEFRNDVTTFDVAEVTRWQTETMGTTNTNDTEQHITASLALSSENPQIQPREPLLLPSICPLHFASTSMTALIRTMLLPASLIQTIALFLPLPNLWEQRLSRLESWTYQNNPNEAIVHALDIIDEVFEEVGLLTALDAANITAPAPHQSWQEWKQSAISNTAQTDDGRRNVSYHSPHVAGQRLILASVAPRPRDEKCPTIFELRRQANYLPLLSRNEDSDTNIVPILLEEPYCIPPTILTPLLHVADVASICRRCCIESDLATLRGIEPHNGAVISHVVNFEPAAAADIVALAYRFCSWYQFRT